MSRYDDLLNGLAVGQEGIVVVRDDERRPRVLRGLRRAAWRKGWALKIERDHGPTIRFTVRAIEDLPEAERLRRTAAREKDMRRGTGGKSTRTKEQRRAQRQRSRQRWNTILRSALLDAMEQVDILVVRHHNDEDDRYRAALGHIKRHLSVWRDRLELPENGNDRERAHGE